MASSMEALEELLPDIDNFLRHILKKETLSSLAEKKRKYYVERLDVFILPPNLPPRPEDETVKEAEDFLAQQRALSRANAAPSIKEATTSENAEEYADMDNASLVYSNDELYEVPEGQDAPLSSENWSDGTSYESYDEDAEVNTREVVYENQLAGHDILLPSVKGKASKELSVKPDNLLHVSFCGELSQRAKLSWPRRYCVISMRHLCVYKSDRDNKPLLVVALAGYDALYFEKESKKNHVIRLAQPARRTHWFCAGSGNSALTWVEHLNAAANDTEVGTDGLTEETSGGSLTSQASVATEHSTACLSQSNLSSVSSEGSSGDGIVQTAADRERKAKRDEAEKKKFSLQTFLTFGKKKGDRVVKKLSIKDIETDIESRTEGQLNVCSQELLGSANWQSLWCVVRRGSLECFRETGDDTAVLSLMLTGVTIDNAASGVKREFALRLLQGDKEILSLEAKDFLDHSRWLTAIIKETTSTAPQTNLASVDESVYENEAQPVHSGRTSEVYSDVYEDVEKASKPLHKTVNDECNGGEDDDGELYDDIEIGAPRTGRSRSTDGVIAPTGNACPPPLPKVPPPVDRLLRRKPSHGGADASEDGSPKHRALNFEAEMTARFSEIQSQYKLSTSESDDGMTTSSGDTRSGSDSGVTNSNGDIRGSGDIRSNGDTRSGSDSGVSVDSRRDTCSSNGSAVTSVTSCESDVIKGHSGRTISQDRDILDGAENPILGELRRGRLGGGSMLEKKQKQEEIGRLRDKAVLIRKTRQQVRGKKMAAQTSVKKQSFEDELETLDTELEETEAKLTKLQLLVQKDGTTSLGGSFKTTAKNNGRTHSFVTCSTKTKASPIANVAKKQPNNRHLQKKQEAVSVINNCITSNGVRCAPATRKITATPRRRTDPCLTSQMARSVCLAAQRGAKVSNGCGDDSTQGGGSSKTSTVRQKLKLWESISDS